MRRLILLRHAKSDWPDGVNDHDRPLDARGLVAAPLIGRTMVARGFLPNIAFVSSARRTRETWALARDAAPGLPEGIIEPRLYEAPPGRLAEVASAAPAEAATVCLVGHNPGTETLAAMLIASGDATARARLARKYPTGGLAVIDLAISSWEAIRPASGRLVAFIVPRDLSPEAE